MATVSVLLVLGLWGMVLAWGYQLLLLILARTAFAPLRFLLYCGGVVLCFVTTALFLYLVNGGEWGIYGFAAVTAGFALYYRRFWSFGEKCFKGGGGAVLKTGRMLKTAGDFGIKVITAPWGAVIAKGERRLAQWDKAKEVKAAAEKPETAGEPEES